MKTLLLSSRDLEEIVRRVGRDRMIDELVVRLTDAFAKFDRRRSQIPVRSGFHYRQPAPGLIEWMPLMDLGSHVLLKVVGYHPENPEKRNLPTILSTLAAYDTDSGHLRAIVDGTLLTSMRTGAASAVASRLLASPQSRTLGVIGCGTQAVTQVHAICRSFEIEEILTHDVDPVVEASLASRVALMVPNDVEFHSLPPSELVPRSDILCVATSVGVDQGPVFQACETQAWLHVNAVGSDFPGKIEVPRELLEESFVCPDFLEQARLEGECQQLEPMSIGPEIAEVARDRQAFESLREQRTVFDSTGWALEDQAALELALDWARAYGIGSEIDLEGTAPDPRDPYAFLGDESSTVDTLPPANGDPETAPTDGLDAPGDG